MAPRISSRPRVSVWLGALAIAAGAAALAGCTQKLSEAPVVPGGSPPAATIEIVPSAATKGMLAFSPDTVTVHVNDTIRLHNGDSIQHDIEPLSPGDPGWGAISPGQSLDTHATATGTFTFVCAIAGHTMVGRIIVTP